MSFIRQPQPWGSSVTRFIFSPEDAVTQSFPRRPSRAFAIGRRKLSGGLSGGLPKDPHEMEDVAIPIRSTHNPMPRSGLLGRR